MDIRREDDPEQLRRIALTQQVQIRHLLDVLQRQSHQLDELRRTTGDLQEKLALLNAMTQEAQRDGAIPQDSPPTPKDRKKRQRFGATPSLISNASPGYSSSTSPTVLVELFA